MNLLGWLIVIVAAVLYIRKGASLRQRITSFVRSGPGASLDRKRLLASLVMALLVGAGSRFLLGSILPINRGDRLRTTITAGPDGAKANLAGGGSINVPAGALEKPTTINVHKRALDRRGDDAKDVPPGALFVYELSPIDTALRQPIELDLPVPAGQNVSVFVTANGQSRVLPSAVQGQTARVSITSFDFNQPGAIDVAR